MAGAAAKEGSSPMRTWTFRSLVLLPVVALVLTALAGCGKSGREDQKTAATPPAEEGGMPAATGTPADLYGRAAAAYLANNDDEAFALLGQIPDGTAESAKAHNLRGLIQARRGNLALAGMEFTQAIAQDAKFAQAHNNMGVVHLADGKPDDAVAAFQAAIQADPYYAAPHRGLAEAYYKQGKMTEAKNELRLVDEIARSQASAAAPGMQDLQIGQPLDVASLIAQEETAAKPKPKPAKKTETAARPAPKPTTKTVTTQVSAPAGSRITIATNQALSTATNKTGEAIEARVVNTVVADGDTLIRAGAPVKGTIASAKSAGRVKGQSELSLAFTAVKTVTGWRELKGHVVEGTLKGGTSHKSDAAKVGIGAAAGAVIGEIVGDKAGVGAAVGAAAGTGLVLATKGKEIDLPAGTSMAVELDEPLAITVEKTVPVE
jgi:Flp pilus assembly protein TadD